jgi:hypothetical protein
MRPYTHLVNCKFQEVAAREHFYMQNEKLA